MNKDPVMYFEGLADHAAGTLTGVERVIQVLKDKGNIAANGC